jgi:hypothetical protein
MLLGMAALPPVINAIAIPACGGLILRTNASSIFSRQFEIVALIICQESSACAACLMIIALPNEYPIPPIFLA